MLKGEGRARATFHPGGRVRARERGRATSQSIGSLLIERGFATQEQINHCVKIQNERARRGDFARLGSILIEEGIVSAAQVSEVLKAQRITILVCTVCNSQYNIYNHSDSVLYDCRKCHGKLEAPQDLTSVDIQDTVKNLKPPKVERSGERAKPQKPGRASRPPPGARQPAFPSSGAQSASPPGRPSSGARDTVKVSTKPMLLDAELKQAVEEHRDDGRFFGDYEILGEIARGGMGIIYKARQVQLNRAVALKTLRAEEARRGDAVERFLREARAVASLRHPNLVAVHSVDICNNIHYFTMEFVEGVPLDRRIEKSGRLSPEVAVKVLLPIAEALDYAHSQGVLHRDLKPSNIIIDSHQTPFLVDFGIAKTKGEDALTEAGEILGSVPYMAPEYIVGEDYSEVSDVYSLGVVLYEALAGFEVLPFGADTKKGGTVRLLKKIAYESPDPLSNHVSVHPELEAIVMKAISKDLALRYAKAGELAADLRGWLEQRERAEHQEEVIKTWRGRVVILSAAALILLGATLFFGYQLMSIGELVLDGRRRMGQSLLDRSRALRARGDGERAAALEDALRALAEDHSELKDLVEELR